MAGKAGIWNDYIEELEGRELASVSRVTKPYFWYKKVQLIFKMDAAVTQQ